MVWNSLGRVVLTSGLRKLFSSLKERQYQQTPSSSTSFNLRYYRKKPFWEMTTKNLESESVSAVWEGKGDSSLLLGVVF